MNIPWEDWCWNSNTLAIWCEEWAHWKRPWCWERARAGGVEGDVGWHHQLNAHEFEQTLGDSEGLESLECCSPQGCKVSDMTEQLNDNKYEAIYRFKVCIRAQSVTSVMSNSLRPFRLWPAKLLCPWDSPGKNTVVGCHALLQGIFMTQGLNPHLLQLLHSRQILYH